MYPQLPIGLGSMEVGEMGDTAGGGGDRGHSSTSRRSNNRSSLRPYMRCQVPVALNLHNCSGQMGILTLTLYGGNQNQGITMPSHIAREGHDRSDAQ